MAIKCPKCQTENPADSKFCKECATPLPFIGDLSVTKTLETPAKGLALGSTFAGRYQIVEELGRGGMGTVYKALDTQINEEVAIKLIRPEIAADEKTLERFSNELKLARKISHKNVCRMYHLEKGEETPYISMEYLEGENLKTIIQKKEKLLTDEAVSIAQQVCEGFAEAHRLGVVHRDLKPQNIMIDKALAINPKNWWAGFNKGDVYFYQDHFEEALRTYQDVLESAPNSNKHNIHLSIAALYESQGRFQKAFEYYENLLSMFRENREQIGEIRWGLGYLYLKTGRPELALDEFKKSFELIEGENYRWLRENLFDQAVTYIEMGNFKKADEILEEMRMLTPEIMRPVIQTQSYYSYVNEFYLKGRMALKRKNYPEAVENLEKAVSALGGENNVVKLAHALYMDSLASAYTQDGDIEQATKTYEKISLLTCGCFLWGDIYAKSFYNLGKLNEERGWKGKAIESYEKFLDIWKGADPGIPEVEHARKRLAGLM